MCNAWRASDTGRGYTLVHVKMNEKILFSPATRTGGRFLSSWSPRGKKLALELRENRSRAGTEERNFMAPPPPFYRGLPIGITRRTDRLSLVCKCLNLGVVNSKKSKSRLTRNIHSKKISYLSIWLLIFWIANQLATPVNLFFLWLLLQFPSLNLSIWSMVNRIYHKMEKHTTHAMFLSSRSTTKKHSWRAVYDHST